MPTDVCGKTLGRCRSSTNGLMSRSRGFLLRFFTSNRELPGVGRVKGLIDAFFELLNLFNVGRGLCGVLE